MKTPKRLERLVCVGVDQEQPPIKLRPAVVFNTFVRGALVIKVVAESKGTLVPRYLG